MESYNYAASFCYQWDSFSSPILIKQHVFLVKFNYMKKNSLNKITLIIVIVFIVGIAGYFIFDQELTPPSQALSPSVNTPGSTSDLVIKEIKELNLRITGAYPKFSPLGDKIVFASRGQDEGLWLVNVDGSNLEIFTVEFFLPLMIMNGRVMENIFLLLPSKKPIVALLDQRTR
ncbi:MAG: hypothetical protein COX77_03410 [Candidatus Komeilibacteria bacterium CG_4_10_14_0_2_um_filter_37_10]|uniref:Dipeptidylpeptidase IV N-terminal domain-containing protein n=1 Tax=Candidatus Komeilibacteria bacterium CG_4_10_14_0_2_um_filter_37_10 TaxID=1974470 RepID=A0A2M7VE83_9BACT|nr:MAG: hypothetical protein COX77_03410 [Candidatus Komeilibacteria bacterium CG_4_10_14_0_2_um_filter_37_10]PJA92510.1 MAG: hypothetical protein CO133_02835 [Candidatus Komeilibacteria bacterium CG_4_9_14_3_um_filter_37_5]